VIKLNQEFELIVHLLEKEKPGKDKTGI